MGKGRRCVSGGFGGGGAVENILGGRLGKCLSLCRGRANVGHKKDTLGSGMPVVRARVGILCRGSPMGFKKQEEEKDG